MSEDQEKAGKPQPTSQQEFNLALMDSVRHLAQYAVSIGGLAAMAAGREVARCRAAGDDAAAQQILDQAEKMRKDGLRYHNSMVDVWEAFSKDAGPLLTPRDAPPKVPVDED